MSVFTKTISLRWSDLDPNFHLRHSIYYDLGSQHRIEILESLGLTTEVMHKQHFGPILFREECVFKKEIRMKDTIKIHTKMAKMRKDGGRWTITHEFINQDDKSCTMLTVEGAWMDVVLRKLANPTPVIAMEVMNGIPKADDFILFD